jgi:hypothetical protein
MKMSPLSSLFALLAAAVPCLTAQAASAQSPTADVAPTGAQPAVLAAPPPAKPPYSIPFQLRPAAAATVLRVDTSFGMYDDPAVLSADGTAIVSTLLGSYKVTDNFAPLLRLGTVSNAPPGTAEGAVGFLNPILGATYFLPLSAQLRFAAFFGVALPVGSGGGDTPNPAKAAANAAGIRARSAMDNALFAVNDVALLPGVDFAYVAHGFTLQVEATLIQLLRARGSEARNAAGAPLNPDSSRTNFTAGVHAGYFLYPELSIGAELRHQRWLSTPRAIANDATGTLRDTTSVAMGPRLHFKLGDKSWLRPALAFAIGVDDPQLRWESKSVQLDIPVVF